MSKFLDELKDFISDCSMEEKLPHRWIDNHEMVGSAIDMIDSLGENARRMLEIGVVQDELVKLGFTQLSFNTFFHYKDITIGFWVNLVNVDYEEFRYISPTWQEDLINRVKELIK